MKVEDIFNRIVQKSGQYLLSKNNIEINIDAFRILVEDALAVYNKSVPYDRTFTVDLYSRSGDLTPDMFPDIGRSPDWVAKATPIFNHNSGTNQAYGVAFFSRPSYAQSEPIESIHKYNKPKITVNISGDWEVIGVWKHRVEEETVSNRKTYEVKTISVDDDVFFDLLCGMFVHGIGMSRRAFTMDAIPISMDADALVSEGEARIEKAKEELNNVQKFYLWI